VGADIEMVRKGIGSDPRIGTHFLYAGTGYGGSCFPQGREGADPHRAGRTACSWACCRRWKTPTTRRSMVLVDKVVARFGEDLSGRCFALWGLAFKPNTDDMREAPSRVIIRAVRAAARGPGLRPGGHGRGEARAGDTPRLSFVDQPMRGAGRRRRAADRHRVEGIPQPDFDPSRRR
jgi:UDPglucose 6-dehydrogenase